MLQGRGVLTVALVGLAGATAMLGLSIALWGLEELVQPKNVQVPAVPASFPCLPWYGERLGGDSKSQIGFQ